MRSIGSYELKTRLSEVLDAVEHGQTVLITRHGKPIARLLPPEAVKRKRVSRAVQSLMTFPRTSLPKGVTIKSLVSEGRR